MTGLSIDAPAKINLGLEILGKRTDGFHEIRTILCTISLRDTLIFEPTSASADRVSFEPASDSIHDDQNLVLRALDALRAAGARIPPQHVVVRKRVPPAAGLGGASSDAAATLTTFQYEAAAAGADLHALAADLGSDVPFFLNGPIALASGRGEALSPLPAPAHTQWVVLVTPNVQIPDKTRTLYGAVDPVWWSAGDDVHAIAERLPSLPNTAPPNVFERALLRLAPEVADMRTAMLKAGAPFVALTGAGPTFYSLFAMRSDAESVALRSRELGLNPVMAELGWTP